VVLISLSCKRAESEPIGLAFYFEKPQPLNDAELTTIPSKFRGRFMNSDSIFINIKENIILKEYDYKFRIHKSELDSINENFVIKGNKYISKINRDLFDVRYLKDSIEFLNKKNDTFFLFF
jgi:hypothetical protein